MINKNSFLISLKYQNKKIQNYLTNNVYKNYFKKNALCIKSITVFELERKISKFFHLDTKVEL